MYKRLVVKDWFARKKAQEKNRTFYTNDIYAIVGETEKAVEVVCVSDSTGFNSFFCPKSCLEIEIEKQYEFCEEVNADKIVNDDATIESLIQQLRMESRDAAFKAYQKEMAYFR